MNTAHAQHLRTANIGSTAVDGIDRDLSDGSSHPYAPLKSPAGGR